jgi:hypothetical protein
MFSVELYGRVRHACHVEGLSQREAARRFGIHRGTVRKMLTFSVPPGYRRTKPPPRPKLEAFTAIIDALLEADRTAPPKQRQGYTQVWCMGSGGGLLLVSLNGLAVAETHALDYLGEPVRTVQPAPVPLGRLGELENHRQRGLA